MLLYGLGSKKKLMTEFARNWLTGYHVLVVNGYFPALTIKNVNCVC